MSENNLDKSFQEKLVNFHEVPDEKVWNHIANFSLDKRNKSRKLIPLGGKKLRMAAIFAILFFCDRTPFLLLNSVVPNYSDVENKHP